MKISILTSCVGQTNSSLFRETAKRPGVELTVYYCSDTGVGKEDFDAQFNRPVHVEASVLDGYRHEFLKNIFPEHAAKKYGLWTNPGIIPRVLRESYDIIIVSGWSVPTYWLCFMAAWIKGTPLVMWAENPLNQERVKKGVRQNIKQFVLKFLFRHIAGFLYIGKENRDLYRSYGVPEDKLSFAPYAMDNERCFAEAEQYGPEKAKIKERIGLSRGKKTVLFVGKLIPKKRPFDLLRAYEELTGRGAEIELLFVGDGTLREDLEAYVQRKGLLSVHFAGFVPKERLGEYYCAADLFVLPSGLGETWGLVVNEAMCFGLPVVVSDMVGCGADLVRDGENGFRFTLGDVGELADKILLCFGEGEESSMGDVSKNIIKRYSYEKDIEGILMLAGRIVSERTR